MADIKDQIPTPYASHVDMPVPARIDWLATHAPNHEFCMQAVNDDCESFRRVSFRELAAAVDYCVSWMENVWQAEEALGRVDPPKPGDVVVYLGRNDIRYAAFFSACSKLGLKVRKNAPDSIIIISCAGWFLNM